MGSQELGNIVCISYLWKFTDFYLTFSQRGESRAQAHFWEDCDHLSFTRVL